MNPVSCAAISPRTDVYSQAPKKRVEGRRRISWKTGASVRAGQVVEGFEPSQERHKIKQVIPGKRGVEGLGVYIYIKPPQEMRKENERMRWDRRKSLLLVSHHGEDSGTRKRNSGPAAKCQPT